MPKIICIANQKGGVGKTTTAFNVGAGMSQQGKKVLLIDFDGQANLSSYLGYENDGKPTISELLATAAANNPIQPKLAVRHNEQENVDYIPSNIALSSADIFLSNAICREQILKKILRHSDLADYDFIIIDCLPSLGVLLTNALAASDSLIIPVQTHKFAMDGLTKLLDVYRLIKDNVNQNIEINGILLTMTDDTNMSKAVEDNLRDTYGNIVYTSKIRRAVEVVNSTYSLQSVASIKNSKRGAEYLAVTNEIIERII